MVALDAWMTVAEAAEYSRMSVRTIRSWLVCDSVNALPCRRVGRRVLIRRSELDRFLDAFKVTGRVGVVEALRSIGLSA
jgi:excisionase family DNA binding protein